MSAIALCALTCAASVTAVTDDRARMQAIGREIAAFWLRADPFLTDTTGVPADTHGALPDISPAGIASERRTIEALATRLDEIDLAKLNVPGARRDYAIGREMLDSRRGSAVCERQWWSVNHMDGWTAAFPDVLGMQPVSTAKDRADALKRWGSFPAYVEQDIANLRRGLELGYSSPRRVVERVLPQVDALLATDLAHSPFYSPVARSTDADFKAQFTSLIRTEIFTAIQRYRAFLRETYLPRARSSLSVLDLPNGRACYDAMLREYTTLRRSGEEVNDVGTKAVAANIIDVKALGAQLYDTRDFAQIVRRARTDPANQFRTEDELVSFARSIVDRGLERTAMVIEQMPKQALEVRPMSAEMRTSGRSSYYLPNGDPSKPAIFALQVGKIVDQTRSDVAITALHEGAPGHHLQVATAASLPTSDLAKISFNSAYLEGWARYAEMLSEEIGALDLPQARIGRRSWPARGMVVDPGLHVLGWSREKAVDFIMESGRFSPEDAEAMVDRISILPGQLTAYDSGALEIKALRAEATDKLGSRFELKAFHRVVLGDGVVPLWYMRENVERWIAKQLTGHAHH